MGQAGDDDPGDVVIGPGFLPDQVRAVGMADLDDAAEPGPADPAVQQGLDDLVVDVSGDAKVSSVLSGCELRPVPISSMAKAGKPAAATVRA